MDGEFLPLAGGSVSAPRDDKASGHVDPPENVSRLLKQQLGPCFSLHTLTCLNDVYHFGANIKGRLLFSSAVRDGHPPPPLT